MNHHNQTFTLIFEAADRLSYFPNYVQLDYAIGQIEVPFDAHSA